MADFKEFDDAWKAFEKGWGGKAAAEDPFVRMHEAPFPPESPPREAFDDEGGLPWWTGYPGRLIAGGAGASPSEENQQAWKSVKEEVPPMVAGLGGAILATAAAPPLAAAAGAARVAPYLPRVVPFVGRTLAGALGYSLGDSTARGEKPRLPTGRELGLDAFIDTAMEALPGPNPEKIPGVRRTAQELGQQAVANVRDLFTSPAGAAAGAVPASIRLTGTGATKAFPPVVKESPLELNIAKEDALDQLDYRIDQLIGWLNPEGLPAERRVEVLGDDETYYNLIAELKFVQAARQDIETVYQLAEQGIVPWGEVRATMRDINEGTAWKGYGGYHADDPRTTQHYSDAIPSPSRGGEWADPPVLINQVLQDPDVGVSGGGKRPDFLNLDEDGYRRDLRHTSPESEVYNPTTGEPYAVWGPNRDLTYAEYLETDHGQRLKWALVEQMDTDRAEHFLEPEMRKVDPGGTVALSITPEAVDTLNPELTLLAPDYSEMGTGPGRGLGAVTAGLPYNFVYPLDNSSRELLNEMANEFSISGKTNDPFRFGPSSSLEEISERTREALHQPKSTRRGQPRIQLDPLQVEPEFGKPHYSTEQTAQVVEEAAGSQRVGRNVVPEGSVGATLEAATDFVLSGDFQPLVEAYTSFDDLNWSRLTERHPNLFRFKFKVRPVGLETGKLEYLKEVELPEGMSYEEALDLQDGPYEILRKALGLDNQDYEISLSTRPSNADYYLHEPTGFDDNRWLGTPNASYQVQHRYGVLEPEVKGPSFGETALRGSSKSDTELATRVVNRGPQSDGKFSPEQRAVYRSRSTYNIDDPELSGWEQMDFVGTSSPTDGERGLPLQFWLSMLGEDVVQDNAKTALAANDFIAEALEEVGMPPDANVFGQLFPAPRRAGTVEEFRPDGGKTIVQNPDTGRWGEAMELSPAGPVEEFRPDRGLPPKTIVRNPDTGGMELTFGNAHTDPGIQTGQVEGNQAYAIDQNTTAGYGILNPEDFGTAGPGPAGAGRTGTPVFYPMEPENSRPLKLPGFLAAKLIRESGVPGFRYTAGGSRTGLMDPAFETSALLNPVDFRNASADLNYVEFHGNPLTTARMNSSINPSISTSQGEVPVATVFQNWGQGMRNIHLFPDIVDRIVQNDMALLDAVPGLEAEKALIDRGELITYSPQVAGALADLIENRGQDYLRRMLKIPEDMGY